MNQDDKIIKSAGMVGLATSLSRVFGYFRDASLALVLGAGFGMDAFTIAFRVANLFRRLVAEGAMAAAFVPVFVAYRKEGSETELWTFARQFFYTLAVAAASIVLLEIIFAPFIVKVMAPGFSGNHDKFELTVYLTRLMAPYLLFVSLAALLMGILNSFGHFLVPALSPIFFNVSIITCAFTLARFSLQPAVAIAYGVLIGGGLQFVAQIPIVFRKGMRFAPAVSFRHPEIQKVGRLLAPSIFGIGIIQFNLLIDSLMASFLSEGSVSHLYYADRIMELVLGIFVISLATVILPDMSKSAAAGNIEKVKSTLVFSFRHIAFVAVPATAGLFVLSDPIIHVLFERGEFTSVDTERTAVALAFYACGLCFISAVRIIVSAFYAVQDTKTPVRVAFLALVVNVALNWILMHPLKQGGIALATSLASAVSLVVLVVQFEKRHGKFDWKPVRESLMRIGTAAGIMGVLCLFFLRWCGYSVYTSMSWKVLALFCTISGGIFVYLTLAMTLKIEEISVLKNIRLFSRRK